MSGAPQGLVTVSDVAWRVLVLAAAVVVVFFAASNVLVVVLPVIVALLVATVLVPLAAWLEAHRVPASLASLLSLLLFVGVVAGFFAFLVPQVAAQAGQVSDSIDEGVEEVLDTATGSFGVSRAQIDAAVANGLEQLQGQAAAIGGGLLTGAAVAVEVLTGLALVLVLLFFVIKDREQLCRWFLARTPERHRGAVRRLADRAWETLAGFVRGQAIIALVDAIGIGIGLVVIGVPLALPLAVLVFFGAFIPIVGAFATGGVAVLVALVTNGPADAALVLLVVVGVQQLEGNLLEPMVLGRAVPLHPIVVLLVVAAGTVLGGIVGVFLAVPLAAVVSALGNEWRILREHGGATPTGRLHEPAG